MALSGSYDLVVEVGLGLLNAVLAAVHENRDTNHPTMPHAVAMFLDDTYRGSLDPVPEGDRTRIRSRVEAQVSTPTIGLLAATMPPVVEGMAARSVVAISEGERREFGDFWPPLDQPKITSSVRLRAWLRDPTDPPMPTFLDGELVVATSLLRSDVAAVGTFLTIDRTTGPEVMFSPATGTDASPEQAALVGAAVRNFIRGDMDPPTFRVSLPADVRRFDFRLRPDTPNPSVLLGIDLTDHPAPAAPLSDVSGGTLTDPSEFSIGVGRDYILGLLASSLFQDVPPSYEYSKYGVSATVRPDWGGASFDLQPGRVVFSLSGDGDISWWGVDDHFTFTVVQAFGLELDGGRLTPVADGDPDVHLYDLAVGTSYLEGKARDTMRTERDAALAAAGGQIASALDLGGIIEGIVDGIHPGGAGVSLLSVDVRSDGVLVAGTLALAPSAPIAVAQVARAGFDDAVETWIPGGTIERLTWQRVPPRPPDVRVEEHRFVTEGMGAGVLGSLCVTVEGTRVVAGGAAVPVTATECFWLGPVVGPLDGLEMGIASERPLFPIVEPGADGYLVVVGHHDPWCVGRAPAKGHANVLVAFSEGSAEDIAATISRAVRDAPRDLAVVRVAVVSEDALRAANADRLPADVILATDADGLWSRAVGGSGARAALVAPDGDVTWTSSGDLSAEELARAVAEHAVPGGEVASHPLRLALRVGERPPDVPIRLPDGREMSVSRLAGRRVIIAFANLRSPPSLDLLTALAKARGKRDADPAAPLVLAIADGADRARVDDLAGKGRFPFVVLPDAERRISSAFGVSCWPTVVRVGVAGRVEEVDVAGSARRSALSPGGV